MKRTIHSLCDQTKAILSIVFSVFFLVYGVFFLVERLFLGSVIFLLLGVLFCLVTYQSWNYITIDETGVTLRRANGKESILGWDEIKEVGILGNKAFPKHESNRGGRKFYYFSEEKMDEQQRFELVLQFPVKNVPYLHYKKEYYEIIQYYWSKELVFYNTGKLDLTMREL